MPIDPRELRRFRTNVVLGFDRPCQKCGYNLKGLNLNDVCPECGHPIRRPGRGGGYIDNLTLSPPDYLRRLACGLIVMACFSVAVAVVFLIPEMNRVPLTAAAAGIAAGGWWLGVFVATGPRPILESTLPDLALDSSHFRWTVRLGQLLWVFAALAMVFAVMSTPGGNAAMLGESATRLLSAIALFALVPLAVYLSSLADWSGDTTLGDRFRGTAWAIAVGGALAAVGALLGSRVGPIRGMLHWAGVLGLGVVVLGELVFLVCLAQLAWSGIWAIRNNAYATEVQRRARERRQQEEDERMRRLQEAIDAAPTPPPPIGAGRAARERLARPKGGAEPYGIEPD